MNWVEVGFGVLGAAVLYYMIYYYRNNAVSGKAFQIDMQNKIDELNIKLADVSSTLNSEKSENQPFS